MSASICGECGFQITDDGRECTACGAEAKHEDEGDRTRRVLLKTYNIGCLLILALLTVAFVAWLVRMFL